MENEKQDQTARAYHAYASTRAGQTLFKYRIILVKQKYAEAVKTQCVIRRNYDSSLRN